MDLNFTPEEERFRGEVREFLRDNLSKALAYKVRMGVHLDRPEMEGWQALLNKKGWLAAHWPVEHGGTGWTTVQKYIFDNECNLAGAPQVMPFGLSMLGPVLIKYGNEAQKRYYLPRILNGDDWWCQGYSEPGSGSDLASLKTAAVRVSDTAGDHYIVNGQKTWTTLGQHANMMFCLVRTRTESKPQEGISFLLIDMKTPGIDMRPIVTLEGAREVNEVFFTDVKVPVENLVGEENKGWTCAKYLLTYERTNIAGVGWATATLEHVKQVASKTPYRGKPLLEDRAFAMRLAKLEIDLENMRTTNLRVLDASETGTPGAESSMLKIRGTQLQQEILYLLTRVAGPHARALEKAWLEDATPAGFGPADTQGAGAYYFNMRKLSIYGGSNEIQRNIISKMILGL